MKIMAKNVEGTGTDKSVLGAWRNNSLRALTTGDARDMLGKAGLSGPKVQSFFDNLMGISDEVTNDAWMARLAAVDQNLYGGTPRVGSRDQFGKISTKSPGYLAENAATRRTAAELGWDPAEVQETRWSFGKTLSDLAESPNRVIQDMESFGIPVPPEYQLLQPTSARDVLEQGLLTDEAIAAVPAFGDLVQRAPYRDILERGGYSPEGLSLPPNVLSSPYERIGIAPEDLSKTTEGRHLLRSADRLDAKRRRTEAEGWVKAARAMQEAATTATEKKRAAAVLGQAQRALRRSMAELPNVPIDTELR
jgi:hypothetical protein